MSYITSTASTAYQPTLSFSGNKETHNARIHASCLEGKARGGEQKTRTGITGPEEEMTALAKRMNKTTGRNTTRFFWSQKDSNINPEDYEYGNQCANEARQAAKENETALIIRKAVIGLITAGTLLLYIAKSIFKM